MLDETIVTETPPLFGCYGPRGAQVSVPITGNRAKRFIHGVLNIRSGDLLLLITEVWEQLTHQHFLHMIRAHWRGYRIVLFQDRGAPHTAEDSLQLAHDLGIEIRFLPVATPELNAMDHLWRHVKREVLANAPIRPIDTSADLACQYLLDLTRRQRLKKAGVLSGNFWLS